MCLYNFIHHSFITYSVRVSGFCLLCSLFTFCFRLLFDCSDCLTIKAHTFVVRVSAHCSLRFLFLADRKETCCGLLPLLYIHVNVRCVAAFFNFFPFSFAKIFLAELLTLIQCKLCKTLKYSPRHQATEITLVRISYQRDFMLDREGIYSDEETR